MEYILIAIVVIGIVYAVKSKKDTPVVSKPAPSRKPSAPKTPSLKVAKKAAPKKNPTSRKVVKKVAPKKKVIRKNKPQGFVEFIKCIFKV
jgi:hypothetical protein